MLKTIAVVVFLVCVADAHAQTPQVDPVQYPGSRSTQFNAINDAGTVVGTTYIDSVDSAHRHAFIYKGGKFSLVDGPASSPGATRGVAINNQGQALILQDAPDGRHYFLYQVGSGVYRPVSLDGKLSEAGPILFHLTEITGINDKDEIAGFVGSGTGVRGTPAIGAPGSPLPPATGGVYTIVSCPTGPTLRTGGINNSGDVVGSCGKTAFIAKQDGTVVTFAGHPTMWMFNNGLGINDAGVVAGFSAVGSRMNGFIYKDQQLTDLPTLAPYSINNRGQIVGEVRGAGFITTIQP